MSNSINENLKNAIPDFTDSPILVYRHFLDIGYNDSDTYELSTNSFMHFIKDFTLEIRLQALTNSTGRGYVSYVNNIGHKLIKSLEIRIGNEIIVSSNLDYGRYLDMLDEYDLSNTYETNTTGKTNTNYSLKKYQDTPITFIVPLKLWFSENYASIYPHILSNNSMYITLKTNEFLSLINYAPIGELVYTSPGISISLLISYYNIDNLKLKNKILNSEYNYIYKHPIQSQNTSSSNQPEVSLIYEELFITDIFWAAVPTARNTTILNTTWNDDPNVMTEMNVLNTAIINLLKTDVNGNDKYNYYSPIIKPVLGTYDTFRGMNILIDGSRTYEGSWPLNAPVLRAGSKNKFIYRLSFSQENKINSGLSLIGVNSLKLILTGTPLNTSMDIYAYVIHLNLLSIINGKVVKNNWKPNNINNNLLSRKVSKIETDIKEQKKSLLKMTEIDSSDAIQPKDIVLDIEIDLLSTRCILYKIAYKNDSLKLHFIIGNKITNEMIENINENNYSLKIIDNNRFLYKVGKLSKLNKVIKLPKTLKNNISLNIQKYLTENEDNIDDITIKHLFQHMIPYSKALRINRTDTYEHILFDDFLEETYLIDQTSNYINNVEIIGRTYELTIENIFDSYNNDFFINKEKHYKIITKLFKNQFVFFEFSSEAPDKSHLLLIPSSLENKTIPEDIFDIFTIKISEEKEHIYENIILLFFEQFALNLNKVLEITKSKENTPEHDLYLTLFKLIYNYSQLYKILTTEKNKNKFFRTLHTKYGKNFFKIHSINRYKLFIKHKEEILENINKKLPLNDLRSIILEKTTQENLEILIKQNTDKEDEPKILKAHFNFVTIEQ